MATMTQCSNERTSTQARMNSELSHEWVEDLSLPNVSWFENQDTFFHEGSWAKALNESYGYKNTALIQRENEEISSIIPMMEVNSWLSGKRGISLPYTDFCQPLSKTKEHFQAAFEELIRYGKSRNWKYIELREANQYFLNEEPSTQYHSHTLKLHPSIEEQFSTLASSTQRAIRKANKSDLKIVASRELKDLKAFYNLQCLTRKRHGLPAQPYSFFKNLYRYIIEEKQGIVFLALLNGAPAAGALFLNYKKKTIYKFGASDITIQSTRANNFVMWEAIKWHIENGYQELHFGRSSLAHEGLRAYKLRWGAKEGSINYYNYNLRTEKFTVKKDAVSGWYNTLFKMLPIQLSQIISKLIYHHAA